MGRSVGHDCMGIGLLNLTGQRHLVTSINAALNRGNIMKTSRDVYDQQRRISLKIFANARRFARIAHPETDGADLMCHNWGNAESKAVWIRAYKRLNRLHDTYKNLYDLAEHAQHGHKFRPLWCKHCQS